MTTSPVPVGCKLVNSRERAAHEHLFGGDMVLRSTHPDSDRLAKVAGSHNRTSGGAVGPSNRDQGLEKQRRTSEELLHVSEATAHVLDLPRYFATV